MRHDAKRFLCQRLAEHRYFELEATLRAKRDARERLGHLPFGELASMVLASSMENAPPIQLLGPVLNGI